VSDFERDGFAVSEMRLTHEQCDYLTLSLPSLEGVAGRAGVRNLLSHPTVLTLLRHQGLGEWIWSVIGRELVAVSATLFDKTPVSNWLVQWHQDRSIAVRDRYEVTGYTSWTTKAGVQHVEPPSSVLAQMVAVRVHLDNCGEGNGALRVIPGSHRSGKLEPESLAEVASRGDALEVDLPRGTLLLMRPLLVHGSSSAVVASHRRVLHVEFAPVEAISPLCWHTAVPLRRRAA